jgi:hypothetical protein
MFILHDATQEAHLTVANERCESVHLIQAVAFDERYRAEMFGQGASREQSGDASTDDDRSPAPKGAARRFTMGI